MFLLLLTLSFSSKVCEFSERQRIWGRDPNETIAQLKQRIRDLEVENAVREIMGTGEKQRLTEAKEEAESKLCAANELNKALETRLQIAQDELLAREMNSVENTPSATSASSNEFSVCCVCR